MLDEPLGDVVSGSVVHLDQHPHPVDRSTGGNSTGFACSDDQITCEIAGHSTIGGLGGPLGDVHQYGEPAPGRRRRSVLGPALNPPEFERSDQLVTQLTFGLDVQIA